MRADLEATGTICCESPGELMVGRDERLTRTRNRSHDPHEDTPEVVTLRNLHAPIGRAVLDAYGRRDIHTDCELLVDYASDEEESGTREKPYRYRWPDAARDEVLTRLRILARKRLWRGRHEGLPVGGGGGNHEEAARLPVFWR